jgi:uncharacterized protein (DUF1015 family)
MAIIRPFPALRPKPELAARICELPYDVMSSIEARAIAKDNPLSFLHVSKPEIDLPPEIDLSDSRVYAQGKANFAKLIRDGALRQDAHPGFYLYRQIAGSHSQTGLVAVASCEEYLNNIIKKHEFTRPDKEDDRVRHIETLNAQTGPAFLTYRARARIDAWVKVRTDGQPDIDFVAPDGVRHTAWPVADRTSIQFVETEFAAIPALYIADGHHRSAAAARIFRTRHGTGGSASFLSVIFPHDQVQILPYNRVLKDLNGMPPDDLLGKLEKTFTIRPGGSACPARRHQLAFYLQGKWFALSFREELLRAKDSVERLDVALLQRLVLGPLFGVDDPRTSQRISFVGGVRGTTELEKLVDSRQYACAFSLFPVSIDELMEISDAGGIMPPKSTWFEPKLRDAMFCHMI